MVKSVVVCCYIEYVPSIFSSTVLSSIYGRVACSVVCTYVFVCCYSSRLVEYVPSISSIVLYRKFYRRVYVFLFRDDVFLPCDLGLEFTSANVRIQPINIRRHMERRHVNREEFRE